MVEKREVGDQLAHAPDEVHEVRALPDLAVHAKRDLAAFQRDAGHRRNLRDDRCVFEILGDVPRKPLVAQRELQIAPRHVQAAGVARDQFVRLVRVCAEPGRAHDRDQLHLMMEVCRLRRIWDGRARFDERLGRFDEIEGPSSRLVDRPAHLDRMRMVVAPNAEDAVDRRAFASSFHLERGNWARRPEIETSFIEDLKRKKMRRRLKRRRRAFYITSAGISGVHGATLDRATDRRIGDDG